jgi:hypothetical protein
MNQSMRSLICLLLASSFILNPSSFLRADGGAVRLSEQTGAYRVTVFTSPTPLRAGLVDVSVLVQDAITGELAAEIEVTIRAVQRDFPDTAIQRPATKEAATNKLYYAANFELPESGWYSLEVSVHGALGDGRVCLQMEAAEPLPSWLANWAWAGWPVLAILLFGIHQVLVRWRSG